MLEVAGGRRDVHQGDIVSDRDIFKERIKELVKKQGNYSKDEIELILLIVDVLQKARHKYAGSAGAAAQDFDFGIRAADKMRQLTAAITLFERLIINEHIEAND